MADSDGSISGYLQKRGEKGPIKGYKKRWFVFEAGEKDKRVFYYPSREESSGGNHLGFVPLDQVTEIRKAANLDFEVITPTRTYYLQAPTDKELEQWLTALRPNIGSGGGSSSASSDAVRERDEKIARLEEQVKELEVGGGGGGGSEDLRKELASVKEEFENYKRAHEGGGAGAGGTTETAKKEAEISSLKKEIETMEEKYGEELVELKKEYFRACAIGIVQQRKITKDLPPVAELYKRCLDDNTEWKDYVPWIKTTLPKK